MQHSPTNRAQVAACVLTVLALLAPSRALAQQVPCPAGSTKFPCGSQLDGVQITAAPAEFSIQARVAQAKIAIGEGLFEKLTVKVLEGATTLCLEEFVNVSVVNGVINLRIGREMSCDLGQVVAERSNLALQICPGGAQCLPPMDFGTVPSALKAGVAGRARKAHRVEVAAQAHYAPRLDTDADVVTTGRVRQGYLEAYAFTQLQTPIGVLAWFPVRRPTARTLVIASRSAGTGEVHPLRRLTLVADTTETTGSLELRPRAGKVGLTAPGGSFFVFGAAQFDGTLSVGKDAFARDVMTSAGPGSVGGDTSVTSTTRTGSATVVAGPLTIGSSAAPTTTERLTVLGGSTLNGTGKFNADMRAGTSMSVNSLLIPAGQPLLASGGKAGLTVSGGVKTIARGDVVIAQLVGGKLELAPPGGRIARIRIRTGLAGPHATFQDAVTLPSDLSCPFGKVRDQVSKQCVDVDECATGEAACGANATCTNTNPGYACTCKTSFIGNGYICTK